MPQHRVPEEHRAFAKMQRRKMTRAEALLWNGLRAGRMGGWKFKRQVPFGPYVADFACAEGRLIVELDGPPHGTPAQGARDAERDRWFFARGFRVVRVPNDVVLTSLPLAVEQIERALEAPSPGLLRRPPSPSRGEG